MGCHAYSYSCTSYAFRDEIMKCEATAADNGKGPGAGESEPTVQDEESELKLGPPGPPFGIVINGTSLVSNAPCVHACTGMYTYPYYVHVYTCIYTCTCM